MGHAAHFLSRLDRVSRDHVELSLSLYNDHELLCHILASARLPDSAPRVAISLNHPQEGPFLVVTREGRFVTCLGEGMRAGDTPIITRGQLDAIITKTASYRARVEARERILGPDGEMGKLALRIFDAGPNLSREEFQAIASIQPLVAREFLRAAIDATISAHESRSALRQIIRRTDKLKAKNNALLDTHWKQFWAIGHLSVFASMGGRDAFGELPVRDPPIEASLTLATVTQGIGALALKGAWAAAKIGRSCLGHYKEKFVEGDRLEPLVESAVALTTISLRHTKLRAEVDKAIARAHKAPRLEPVRKGIADIAAYVCEDVGRSLQAHREIGAGMIVDFASKLPKGSKYHFEHPNEVPADLAFSFGVNLMDDFLKDVTSLAPLFVMLPWTARAEPQDLYMPADFLKVARVRWRPADTLYLLMRDVELDRRPRPKPAGPSRSGPCPCGSGKKYKRCCDNGLGGAPAGEK